MERKDYREAMIKENDIMQAGQNCRISLFKFFSMIVISQERLISKSEINAILMPLIKKGLTVTFADDKYKVVDIGFWKKLREASWFHQGVGGLDYQLDFSDCDNYAELATSMVSMFKKVNTLGRGSGYLTYKGEATPHAYDIVLAIDIDGKIKPFLYDTEFKTEVVGMDNIIKDYGNCSWATNSVRFS